MAVIYEPKGRALEYSELACNLYMGCTHGCRYCFAPSCMRKTPEQWHSEATPRKGVMEAFEREAKKLAEKGETRPILFSFLSDPYQPLERTMKLTHQALEIVSKYRLKSKILTKGHADMVEEDLPLMKQAGTELGITLSFCDDTSRQEWEPAAATVHERIELLKKAHGMGVRTWVSMEPVIVPEEALELLRMLSPFVDHWKIGKLNHFPQVEKCVDWIAFRESAKEILDRLGVDYYFKKSLTEL